MNMINSNKIGVILQRLKVKFKHDNIYFINKGKQFYNLYINSCTINTIIRALKNPINEYDKCYKFSYDIPYDFRNFTPDDYSYIRAKLTADLSDELNVYVNCNINSYSCNVEGNEAYYVKIDIFIRKPPKG